MSAGLALVGAGAAACGLWAHSFLTDERLWRDPFYEAWLRLRSPEALDRRARGNPRSADLVVVLTTIPSRLGRIGPTIKSLLRQTCRPAEIRLHLPEWSRRESAPYLVPPWLTGLSSLRLERTEDLGPATKLLPALRALAPERRILVVDDDRIYNPHLVEAFDRWSQRLPDAAIGARGWRVPDDLTDRPTTLLAQLRRQPPVPLLATTTREPVPVDVLQGLAGYLVRPSFFDLDAVFDYSGAPEAAFFVDDVWVAAHCRAPKLLVPIRRSNFPSYGDGLFHKRTGLGLGNRGGGDPERRSNTIVIRHFRDRWGRAR